MDEARCCERYTVVKLMIWKGWWLLLPVGCGKLEGRRELSSAKRRSQSVSEMEGSIQ
jgi:hypothetical protein